MTQAEETAVNLLVRKKGQVRFQAESLTSRGRLTTDGGCFKMVQTFPLHANESHSATIRAFSSLTRRDADAVRATLRAAACSYTVQEHDDYDGYLSLLLTPADETRPSFMVAGRTGAVDLSELQGDDMAALGSFPSIGAAMSVLRPALERNQPGSNAPTATATAAGLRKRHGADAVLHAAMRADATPIRPGWTAVLRTLDDLGAA